MDKHRDIGLGAFENAYNRRRGRQPGGRDRGREGGREGGDVPRAKLSHSFKGSTTVSRLGSKKKGMDSRSFPRAGKTR